MSTVAFDTLAFSKRLQEAGVPPDQADAHARAQADFLTDHLLAEMATKNDLAELEARLAWRLITAGIAIAGVAVAAVVALLRLVG